MTRSAVRGTFYTWLVVSAVAALGGSRVGGVSAHSAPPQPPHLLSETGLYEPGGALRVDPRNRPYSPQYPLWSDGAGKARWVYLPPEATIDVRNLEAWDFPAGTKFWKEFAFNGRRVETRFLWRTTDGEWVFASYRWNDAQTDAVLASPDGEFGVSEVAPHRQHDIPSIEECRACHDSARTEILGFNALQLSTDRDPLAIHGEPLTPAMVTLQTLTNEGALSPRRPELLSEPPRIHAGSPRARAILGYLSTNCGMCHNGEGSIAALGMLLKQPSYGTAANAALTTTVGRRSTWLLPGAPEGASLRIAPNHPELSALLYRMRSRRPSSQMPPLGSVLPDHDAIAALSAWIADETGAAPMVTSH